ncbi:MAG: type II secretion system protein GspM [Pseudomonadota bacterium]
MSGRLIDMLAARTGRERMLLAVLVLVALPVLIGGAVLWPLHTGRLQAEQARNDALALHQWVVARAAEAPAVAATDAPAPIGSTGVEQTLIAAGLRQDVTDLGVRDGGEIELRFDAVTFVTLANWISAQAPVWGYDLSRFRIAAHETPGKVSATLVLSPPAS